MKRTAVQGGYAGTVRLLTRLCLANGPGAVVITREARKLGAATKVSRVVRDPLGVDLTRRYPYDCVSGYMLSWIVPAKLLIGGGTYSVNVRVRDGYGRLSAPALFSLRL